ncbi:hypothetical protein [Streptomyces scopuliridis]|uniref:hypothetical protein n=1 Tax=Streptomyces scopuliridis TaxID=452529 RepID=UPI00369F4D31
MAVMSKKFLISVAALVVVGLTTATLYVLGLPPFEKRGEIKASKITTNNKVAIQAPCAKPGSIPGDEYRLSVRVDLETKATSADAKVRQGLKDLTIEAARYAHTKAECNLPSKLSD